MPGMTRDIPRGSPLHQKIISMITSRIRYSERSRFQQLDKWQTAEEKTIAYIPESDMDAQRRADRTNMGRPHYTTIQLPYSYSLIMAAHTYLTSVFFSRTPVHQFAARHGEAEAQVQAVEALIGYQVETGQMLVPYYIWIYDHLKYGVGILNTWWQDEVVQFSNVMEETDPFSGRVRKVQDTVQIPGYRGNKIRNISPFDFFHDPRYPLYRFQDGEFCGVRFIMGWNEMIRRRNLGYYMNTEFITSRFAPSQQVNMGSSALQRPEIPGFILDAEDQGHPMAFYAYELYVDLVQSEWGLGDSDYPEKWVFTVSGDLSLIIGAQPLGSAHGKYPFDVMVGEVEGYGLWTRGTPDIVKDIQNTLDWLINSHFYNVRAALNNQFIIDPSKIVVRDAEDGGPGFIYRLRPEAYGSDLRQFFYQVPVQDVTASHLKDMESMFDIGEKTTGLNDQMFGALSQSGRRTATEVRTSTGFGVNRQKTMSEYNSALGMSPHAMKLVQHSQQWYEDSFELRIMGQLAQDASRFIMVDPVAISGFYDLVPVDGTLPIDRMAMANLWQQMLGQIQKIQPLAMQLDYWKLFSYIGNLMGLRNINQFRVQVMPDQLLAAQAQQGNAVPVGPGGKGAGPSAGTGSNKGGTAPMPALNLASQQPNLGGGPF